MSTVDNYLSVKQEGYCFTYFPKDKSVSQPVVEVSVEFLSGKADSYGGIEKVIMDCIGGHWLNKC